jgi:hypothetical protein
MSQKLIGAPQRKEKEELKKNLVSQIWLVLSLSIIRKNNRDKNVALFFMGNFF